MQESGEGTEKAQSVILETDTERDLSIAELRKKCLEYAHQNLQGRTFTNKATGREIMVSREGLGEWKMKSKTREQVLSIKILDQMLENATFDHDAPDEQGRLNIENFSYFNHRCVINGTPFVAVIITIKRTKHYGDKYYHHYLEDIKIEPYSGAAPTLAG